MSKVVTSAAALLMSTTLVSAGGLDRSGQSISAIFEEGDYAELSFGYIMPDVSGIGPNATLDGLAATGNVAPAYNQLGFAFKTDLNEKFSLALIFDQPFGAAVSYAEPGYALYETSAEVTSSAITALGRYKMNDRFSVHGGLRHVSAQGSVSLNDPATGPGIDYEAEFSTASGVGYVLGAAYEKPEIALRVALTYSSEVDLSLPTNLTVPAFGAVTPMDATLPQSINLDFQTGVAADTLLFGSIRWVDWPVTELNPFGYPGNPLLSYDDPTTTYSIGIGRRFSESFSGSISVGYEKSTGELASNLSPTDGYLSVSLGGAYTLENGVKLSGGVRYLVPGDATTEDLGASFTDNSVIALGLKISTNF